MRIRILSAYSADLEQAAKDLERRANYLLRELEVMGCTIHRIELEHQMENNTFSILALIMYTCHEEVRK